MTERRSPDPDTLAAPFPGPNPGGVPVAAAVRRQLEEARRTIDPAAFAPNDPLRPPTRKDPDWAAIVGLCTTTLTASKDLHVAARLTEALTEVHGFAGLAAGFRLLRLLVRDGWDHAYPPLEDGPEDRAPPFLWLAEPTRGARFPAKVRPRPCGTTTSP